MMHSKQCILIDKKREPRRKDIETCFGFDAD